MGIWNIGITRQVYQDVVNILSKVSTEYSHNHAYAQSRHQEGTIPCLITSHFINNRCYGLQVVRESITRIIVGACLRGNKFKKIKSLNKNTIDHSYTTIFEDSFMDR